MGPTRKDVRYMMQHDPNYIGEPGKGQLYDALNDVSGHPKLLNQVLEEPSGPSNQEISMQMWSHIEQNYAQMQRGEAANFSYDPNSQAIIN